MKKVPLIILILCASFVRCNAQKLKLGFQVSPEANFLIEQSASFPTQIKINRRLGLSSGVTAQYRVTNKLSLRSGVCYSFKRFVPSSSRITFFGQQNMAQFSIQRSVTVDYNEIGVPLDFIFNKEGRQVSFVAGVLLNYQWGGTTEEGLTRNDLRGINILSNTTNVSTMVGVNYIFQLSDKTQVVVEPFGKLYLWKFTLRHTQLVNVGLRLAVNCNV